MASGPWGPRAWLAVMAIIGVVQLVRQQWFAAGLFLLAAIVLAVDLIGPRRTTARRGSALQLTVLVPVAAGFGMMATTASAETIGVSSVAIA